jgi:suppressor of fused protein SUFU
VAPVLDQVRAHLREHYTARGLDRDPDAASVTFLGVERIDVLRFGPGPDGELSYVSLGCARHPMGDPAAAALDPVRGPRAEVVVRLKNTAPTPGLVRTVAVLAATPAVDGVVLVPDALIDLGAALWERPGGLPPFSAILLGPSDIDDLVLPPPIDPIVFLSAVPITANEAAWVRLKGAEALRETWRQDGIDTTDPQRAGRQPT